jgi:hypothetical protein
MDAKQVEELREWSERSKADQWSSATERRLAQGVGLLLDALTDRDRELAEAKAERDAARAELAGLREAVWPFIRYSDEIAERDEGHLRTGYYPNSPTVDDYRKLRAAAVATIDGGPK